MGVLGRRVAITGLGLVAAHGQDPEAAFRAWCAGQSAVAMHAFGEAPHNADYPFAMCVDFDAARTLPRARLASMDRVSQLATVAAMAAWNDAGLHDLPGATRDAVGVYWGTGAGGSASTERSYRDLFLRQRPRVSPLTIVQAMSNAPAAHVAMQLGLGGECLTYSVACASSTVALGEAFRRIRAGEAVLAVAGGAEAAAPYGPMKAWDSMHVMARGAADATTLCRPFDATRSGLVLGEGAATLVLEDWDHARQRGARVYAEVIGYGASCDHSHLTAPDAAGQLRALRQALRVAGLAPQEVNYVNAHGTGTPEGDPVEMSALRELFQDHAAQVMISATKSVHGHLLGAAGAIEALATTLTLHHAQVPPTAHLTTLDPACGGLDHVCGSARTGARLQVALSNSFAFGGSNAVLAMRAVTPASDNLRHPI